MQSVLATYTDQSDLPPELCAKPLSLVGISGLDTTNNAIHKAVWETFNSNRRIERSPVLFRLISNSHEFPIVKPKRNSYEWYIPKGILKKNWMNKYLNEIPAVISVFYDLDWNDSQWNEKMIECASRVQSIRAALDGRNTRIVVVLIQDTLPLPTGEDILATERAVALCASCELNAKSLFVLPHGDHLQGYVIRLENAFYDLAKNFYHLEAKNVKSHREHLSKTTHQYLFVRHQFKMGFLNELQQDNHTAHKHYTHAYNNLLEIRVVDTNAMEIRTVAGFINYKLCRLMFGLSLPRDAISQFRSHTDRFKMRIGFQELAFEHHAWLSKQFSVFGDIFDEAVKLGLPAVQTQHPGLYYQQAAQYAIARKKSCHELCQNITSYPTPDPLENLKNIEFYGQRSWRPGKLTAEPPDPHLESRGIQALQFLETQINHSNNIISLFGFAISQYKTYRCLRMRRYLVVQMAEEYYNSGDYGKSLTLFTHMLWDYRTENWWNLLTDILHKALQCAYLTASIQDYVSLSLELIGPSTKISTNKRKDIYENVHRIINKQIPEPDVNTPSNAIGAAHALWTQLFASQSSGVSLDMSNILCCIDTKARFTQSQYQGDQPVTVEILVRSSCIFPLQLANISCTISSGVSQTVHTMDKAETKDLTFNGNDVKKFVIEFMPDPNDIEKELQIGAVNLWLCNGSVNHIDLKFTGLGNEANKVCADFLHFRRTSRPIYEFDNLKLLSKALIVPRDSKLGLKIDHHQPALLGEWYQIRLSITNKEVCAIDNLQLDINLTSEFTDQTELYTSIKEKAQQLPLLVKLKNLGPSESVQKKIYLRCYSVGPRNVCAKISYLLKSKRPIPSVKEELIDIPVVKPFELTTKFSSSKFGDISKFYVDEPFIIMPVINCLSPWPIEIKSATLECSTSISLVDKTTKSQVEGVTLRNGDNGTDIYYANVLKPTETPIEVGHYSVKWKRENGETAVTQIKIKGLSIEWIPLNLELPLPAYGLVRTPLLVNYKFYNRSQHLLQLDMNMEASEAFMYAGYKQLQLSILPSSTKTLQYNLYPLVAGNVMLPKLSLTVSGEGMEGLTLTQEQLDNLIDRSLPTHVFIMPQGKKVPVLTEKAIEVQ
uniref:Trafficking protein particle complex subunit 11 n=1 Tax=Photinus pyralis TaxID=7054 RepID=A0A1Y1MLA7_PHOPY